MDVKALLLKENIVAIFLRQGKKLMIISKLVTLLLVLLSLLLFFLDHIANLLMRVKIPERTNKYKCICITVFQSFII